MFFLAHLKRLKKALPCGFSNSFYFVVDNRHLCVAWQIEVERGDCAGTFGLEISEVRAGS